MYSLVLYLFISSFVFSKGKNKGSWDDPRRMVGYTADEMASVLGDGWERGTYGSQGDGWKFLKKGDDISVFYHPEGGTHGGEYWGISSGEPGKIKVVDPNTYIPRKDDHATIIYR